MLSRFVASVGRSIVSSNFISARNFSSKYNARTISCLHPSASQVMSTWRSSYCHKGARSLNTSSVLCPSNDTFLSRPLSSAITANKLTAMCLPSPKCIQVRTLTKFSMTKGTRKSVKAVVKRFYRLDWGIWIHTKCGRHKKLWKKSPARKRRLRQHVFCNATQSTLLDKMVTNYWKRPRYYVDDPYTPYHSRDEFPTTRRKPHYQ